MGNILFSGAPGQLAFKGPSLECGAGCLRLMNEGTILFFFGDGTWRHCWPHAGGATLLSFHLKSTAQLEKWQDGN